MVEVDNSSLNNEILIELKKIRKDLDYIKERIIDADNYLTKEEIEIYEQSIKEFKEGKTYSLEEVKKELGL